MKFSRMAKKCLKPKNLTKLLVLVVVVVALGLLINFFMNKHEGFSGNGHKTLLLNHMNGCGHCERLMPEWDKFVSENNTDIKTKKVEVNEDPSVAKKYKVDGFPTILLIGPNGDKLETYNGERTSSGLLSYAKKL